jgi:hypothetical protein
MAGALEVYHTDISTAYLLHSIFTTIKDGGSTAGLPHRHQYCIFTTETTQTSVLLRSVVLRVWDLVLHVRWHLPWASSWAISLVLFSLHLVREMRRAEEIRLRAAYCGKWARERERERERDELSKPTARDMSLDPLLALSRSALDFASHDAAAAAAGYR